MKKQRRKVGDIVSISLTDGKRCFAMILPIADAFFDILVDSNAEPIIEDIIRRPVLFQIPVMNYAVTKGIWTIVGHVEPPPSLLEPPKFFIQSSMNGLLFITTTGDDRIPASFDECVDLECCAVWDPEHVVSRLEDHFAGRPSKHVEILRPKRMPT